ncbi:unnamed protein product [Fraxinus pennsylvanica]|uniref:GATA-type domain-containing protein n=1 Tax=Fraxinus pennsylvanica TaxID=56036 RepID=A0AAD2E113_9LAMI|nr:unnamed protein product [Fraxinus pennsylvanica]
MKQKDEKTSLNCKRWGNFVGRCTDAEVKKLWLIDAAPFVVLKMHCKLVIACLCRCWSPGPVGVLVRRSFPAAALLTTSAVAHALRHRSPVVCWKPGTGGAAAAATAHRVYVLNMNMVEPKSCWDGIVNGAAADEEFESILSLLDFPMESLEGDGLVGEWDVSKAQFLGPIPTDTLMELPPNPRGKSGTVLPHPLPKSVAPIDETREQKKLPEETSSSIILRQHKFTEAQECGVFQTQSPVSVLESSRCCSVGKCVPIKSKRVRFLPWSSAGIVIPVQARSKRVRSSTVNPWLSISSTSKKTSNFRKNKDKRKKLSQIPVANETMDKEFQKAKASSMVSDSVELQNTLLQRVAASKKCTHCEVTKTPQWREGPTGPKTLCNACGVRYRSGRLYPEYRPAASPTFVPSVHSNSHKKVIEMRNKGKEHVAKVEEPLISPHPGFVPMGSYLFDFIC